MLTVNIIFDLAFAFMVPELNPLDQLWEPKQILPSKRFPLAKEQST